MKGKKLKPVVKKTIIVSVLVLIVTVTFALLTNQTSTVAVVDDNFIYVNDYIFDSYYPVVNNEEKVVRPYTSSSVTIFSNIDIILSFVSFCNSHCIGLSMFFQYLNLYVVLDV